MSRSAQPEREYLKASIEQRDADRELERERRDRERLLERRAVRRLRGLVAVFAAAALVAASLTLVATDQSERAERASQVSAAREFAAAAIASIEDDPERAVLLAIEAVERTRTPDGSALPEAIDALHRAVASSRIVRTIAELGGPVAWGAGGTFAAVRVDEPGTVEIRDGGTGEVVRTIATGAGEVSDLGFDRSGSVLAVAAGEHLGLYDAATGTPIADIDGRGPVGGVSFSSQAPFVAAAWSDERVVRVIDVETGTTVATLDVATWRTALDPTAERVAVADTDGTIVLDVASGNRVAGPMVPSSISGEPYGVSDIAWSPNGGTIAVIGLGGLDLWDAASWDLRAFEPLGWGDAIGWSADASHLVTAGPGVRVWPVDDQGNLGQASTLPLPRATGVGETADVAVSPDGARVIASGARGTVGVWDSSVQGDAEWAHLDAAPYFGSVAFLPDGTLVGANAFGRMTTWNPETAHALRAFGARVREYLFSPSPGGLVPVPRGSSTELWDASHGALVQDLTDLPEAWSPDGARFLSGNAIYENDGHLVASLDAPPDLWVEARAWSDDGRWIIGALPGPTVRLSLWDATTGVLERTIATDLSGEGLYLATRGTRVVLSGGSFAPTILDIGTGETIATLGAGSGACGLAFSPDGELVAVGGGAFVVRLFDATDGDPVLALDGHARNVCGIAFSEDGTMLATQSPGEIRVWALDLDDLLSIARRNVTRPLAPDECRRFLHEPTCG